MKNYEIKFYIDAKGIFYDYNEPIHLDGLIEYAYCCEHDCLEQLEHEDTPKKYDLPLESRIINDSEVYCASALFPLEQPNQGNKDVTETLTYWRKRARMKNIDLCKGSLNEMQGVYRSYNTPLPICLIPCLVGYFRGDGLEVQKLLRHIKSLGKKRAYGFGKILKTEIKIIEQEYFFVKNNIAMRHLPTPTGQRLVRAMPPYWHRYDRVKSCEVGDKFNAVELKS
jgi:CRISPR type IV-associated protein Csf3